MFKFLLAFIVWLFATNNWQAWANLVKSTNATAGSATGSTGAQSTAPGNAAGSGSVGASGSVANPLTPYIDMLDSTYGGTGTA